MILNFEFVTLSTPLFTRNTYEAYICIKSKKDMKTKMIICENPIEQKMGIQENEIGMRLQKEIHPIL